jgi:predicted nucleic acid-binding protein
MGTGYVLDTSAVSKYLRGKLSEEKLDFMDTVLVVRAKLSVIARIELEVFNPPTEAERALFLDFIRDSEIFDLTEPIILQTIRIRRQHRVRLPDAIIAATAMVHNLTLLSTNDGDFEKITGLTYKSLNT